MFTAIVAGFEYTCFLWNGLKSSAWQHNVLLNKILHAKMEFFERTPIGRILNRFSSDVSTTDHLLPEIMYTLTSRCLGVAGAIIIMFITTPYSMIVWAAMAVIYAFVQVISYLSP